EAVDRLLPMFGIKRAAREHASADQREEEIYTQLLEAQQARRGSGVKPEYRTYTGKNRPDIVGIGRFQPWRKDYEDRLAEGIRLAVEGTVRTVAETLGDEATPTGWGPAVRARRWVMSEFPLLGALAPQLRIIADAKLC